MQRIIQFLSIITLVGFISCGEKEGDIIILPKCMDCEFSCVDLSNENPLTNDCLDNHTCTFEVHPNSKTDYSQLVQDPIKSGDKLVFQLKTDTQGAPEIADDEFTRVLTFEMDPDITSFSLEVDQFDDVNLRFILLCFCSDVNFKQATAGCIEGEKITDEFWQVQINADFLIANTSLSVVADAVFEIQ
jgi:hypothetical protein